MSRPAWRDVRRGALVVFAVALGVRLLSAAFVRLPGYMDAFYYFHLASRLAAGQGLTEIVAWNYLGPPPSLPRPGGAYWPPGTAILAAGGLTLAAPFGAGQPLAWRAAQLVPVLLSAAVAAGTYVLSRRLAPGPTGEWRARLAAGLVILSGVYFPYWVTTDTFAPFALAGGACLWLAADAAARPTRRKLAAAALVAGAAQLIRPDALLLTIAPLTAAWQQRRPGAASRALVVVLAALAGALPWLARNWITWHALTPPGSRRALWLRDYDDLFAFASPPNFARWQAAGAGPAITLRLGALLANLGALGQPFLFYLVPLALLGLWHLRRRREHRPVVAYVVALYLLFSLVFPAQGVRGGLFHSLSAALPFFALWTAIGLEAAIGFAARRRRWDAAQARVVFGVALLGLSAFTSCYFLALQTTRWSARDNAYRQVATLLATQAPPDARVLVVDPPGFWYASGHPAIVIPSDGFDALLAAASTFGAAYLVVEESGPAYLAPLWTGGAPQPGFTCAGQTPYASLYVVDPARSRPPSTCPPVPGHVAALGRAP